VVVLTGSDLNKHPNAWIQADLEDLESFLSVFGLYTSVTLPKYWDIPERRAVSNTARLRE